MKFKSYKLQQREMLRRSEHAPREQQKMYRWNKQISKVYNLTSKALYMTRKRFIINTRG